MIIPHSKLNENNEQSSERRKWHKQMKHQHLPSDSRDSSVTAYSNTSGLMTNEEMLDIVMTAASVIPMTKLLINCRMNGNQTTDDRRTVRIQRSTPRRPVKFVVSAGNDVTTTS